MEIGKKIALLRKGKNMSQKDLAVLLNVTDKAVSRWESGTGNPDVEIIPKIAQTFGVSIDYLMDNSESNDDQKQNEGIDKLIKCLETEKDLEKLHTKLAIIKKLNGSSIIAAVSLIMLLTLLIIFGVYVLLFNVFNKIPSFDYHIYLVFIPIGVLTIAFIISYSLRNRYKKQLDSFESN